MSAKLSNIALFCDDLAFVIAKRRSAQNAADVANRGNSLPAARADH